MSRHAHAPSCLVALPARWRDVFLPRPGRGAELEGLFTRTHWCEPDELTADALQLRLNQLAPAVIVTGWGTPMLPARVPGLRYVCHLCGSVRRVPRELLESGVLVTNWGGIAAETVAEAALLLILSSLRRSHHMALAMHGPARAWPKVPDGALTLRRRKVGLHGFGRVARNLVALLRPFQVELSAYSEGVPGSDFLAHGVRRADSLETLFREADIVVEAEALTPLTQGTVTAAVLGGLRPGAVFVNVGRGEVVDEPALIALAAAGRIRVALDVYTEEPLPADSPLRGLPDAVLFPHAAGPTEDQFPLLAEHAVANIRRFLRGAELDARITLDAYERST